MRRSIRGPRLPPVLAVLLLAIASVASGLDPPLEPWELERLQALRDFAGAAAQRYRMPAPVEVSVVSWLGSAALPQYAGTSALYTRGALYVSRRFLDSPYRAAVVAKALAHETLRAPSQATTLADRERERVAMDREANARAVDVLVQVGGMTEEAALDHIYAWLAGLPRAAAPAPGAPAACDAIRELLERFPQHRERFQGRACAAG